MTEDEVLNKVLKITHRQKTSHVYKSRVQLLESACSSVRPSVCHRKVPHRTWMHRTWMHLRGSRSLSAIGTKDEVKQARRTRN